jgi:DNA-binding NarL/FixJ family response regulator
LRNFATASPTAVAQSNDFPFQSVRQPYEHTVPQSQSGQSEDVSVLVVDDHDLFREIIVDILDQEPGFIVSQAQSLAQARGMLEGVDVAILDLSLPDGSGVELIQELHDVNSDAKAIVFSSALSHATAHHALDRGAAAALDKLDGFRELLATVKRLQ